MVKVYQKWTNFNQQLFAFVQNWAKFIQMHCDNGIEVQFCCQNPDRPFFGIRYHLSVIISNLLSYLFWNE